MKDVIDEDLFLAHRDLFSGLDCVFFDTTSIYSREREAKPSANWATPRIIALTSIRWWWESFWTITVSRPAVRCGRGTQRM